MPEIFDCEQGTEDWFRCRMGIPTASEFHTVLAKTPGGKADGKTRQTYMRKLAGEIITDEPMESYTNAAMERGKIMEDEARQLYAFAHECEPQQVGFIKNGKAGWSPDSLIGAAKGLEIKTAAPHVLIEFIERDEFPSVHKAQCQGGLWVGELESIDLVIFWPAMPLFEKTVYRDEAYIKTLEAEVDRFNDELHDLVERIRRYGQPIKQTLRECIKHEDMMNQLQERPQWQT
jgi:YqaJ-like recombinase protein